MWSISNKSHLRKGLSRTSFCDEVNIYISKNLLYLKDDMLIQQI